jgi:hypothetical protein
MKFDKFLRDYWQCIDALDLEKFLSFFAPDCTMRFANAPVVHGISGVRDIIAPVMAGVAGISHHQLGLWVNEDATVVRGDVTYTRHDRSTVTLPFMCYFEFTEGLIRSTQIYIDIAPLYAVSSGG